MFLENIGGARLDQVFSAAAATAGFMRFKGELDAERVPVQRDRKGQPLCMDQWRYMYGTTRVPGLHVDALAQSSDSQHIVVMRKGHMFRVEFGDLAHLCWAFRKVVEESEEGAAQSIGALTGWARNKWSAARKRLIALSAANAATLRIIESAAFVVVLDSGVVQGDGNGANNAATLESDDDQVRRFHHCTGGQDRWFDKSFTVIVNPVGQVGLNVEHSWAEASVPLSVMSGPVASFVRQCYSNEKMAGPALTSTSPLVGPRGGDAKAAFLASQRRGHGGCYKLQSWQLDEEVMSNIAEAQTTLAAMEADSDISLIRCHDYTARTMKALKVSPDSCLQMAIQLAFYRIHGRSPHGTYETAVLTQFLKGRTATCRVVSTESQAFCWAMVDHMDNSSSNDGESDSDNNNTSKNKAIAAFKLACKSHISYIQKTSRGEGVDRHLLGLSASLPPTFAAPPPAVSELFKDPLFLRAQSWELSTSNNSYLDNSGGHFGTVNPNGYGIGYLAKKGYTYFAVECKRSARLAAESHQSAAKRMSAACVQALTDIHTLFSVGPASGTAKI